jgi:uroporphyrinogen decarboxylase
VRHRIIEIGVAAEEIEARRRRVETALRFGTPDRVPVQPAIGCRFLIPKVGVRFRTNTCDGPFGIAGDLMGATELFTACAERPEFVRELLRIVTDKMLAYLDACAATMPWPAPRNFAWSDDLAVSLSREMFEDLVLPANRRLRDHFDGRLTFHMCGRSDHLLETFRDGLAIHVLQGFGWAVDLDTIARVMGGKVVLIGNVDPRLILSGTPDDVREATRRVIDKLARFRGFIVQDGNNIPPGSPLENINAMMEATERYGRYDQ